ncbi:hypothetical protein FCM35_KLT10582 [Carex littledalei]|uniref:Uncharacterized protein n=1 Tax=Carex littledalei TaxID=544730 RepID=A0A833V546_9POAL|nr:hypothetical protein FCM35_KLT10582 [Carex littledalei]
MASSLKKQASMDGSEICVDTHPPDFSKWVDAMDAAANEVDLCREEAAWKKPSIYRVTGFARCHNPNAFTPQVISFGPFHHDSELLKATEVHKHRALAHFLHRAGMRSEPFGLEEKWKENPYEFLKMMLLDGCFMIEVLRTDECPDDYAPNDPVFSSRMKPLRKPYIKRDMLLLENQLPLLVLKALLEVENLGPADDKYINCLVLSYCGKTFKANLPRLANHPLELYRMSLLPEDAIVQVKSPPINGTKVIETRVIENAVDLRASGVHFRIRNESTSLMDINFDPKTGRLYLPVLSVHDGTEHLLLNMVAYEQIHVGVGNEITSYAMFMDALIDTADDKKKIISNSLGSHKDVAELFNRLPKEAAHDPNDALNMVRYDLSEFHENKGNRWLANLRHQYLHNPWKVLSIVAALLVILLTFIQTLYSVLSFHLGKS